MLESPDLLIIPLLCAARNMDPDTSGAEVPAANVASYRGHLYFFFYFSVKKITVLRITVNSAHSQMQIDFYRE